MNVTKIALEDPEMFNIFFSKKFCRAILDEEVNAIINNNRHGQARYSKYPANNVIFLIIIL